MEKRDFDAIVVGSGPNGLAAAIYMQQQGLSVLLVEAENTIGGGLRSKELTLPGFIHDVCSAIHPMAMSSPFFSTLPLSSFGLQYLVPDVSAAHPLDDGSAAVLYRSIIETAKALGEDEQAYLKLISPVVKAWPTLAPDILGPLSIPAHPVDMALFGKNALLPATVLAKKFKTQKGKGLWAGMAAHSIQPLTNLTTSAIGLVLMAASHLGGWPVPVGGSMSIANALTAYFRHLGGTIQTGFRVQSLAQLPSSHVVLFDVTPAQLLKIAGHQLSPLYRWQLNKYRYGMGVFKVDWALDAEVPFIAAECRKAGTIHIGNTFEEINEGEKLASAGKYVDKPFVLLAQQSLFDKTRAPEGKHTLWGYCHVPNASGNNMVNEIENQIERFAPGFKERILARHVMGTRQMEDYNANYIGGDINGGIMDVRQLFTRPALRLSPYKTSQKGIYICSSSTPPGGGVHGMCGYHAAKKALKDVFKVQ